MDNVIRIARNINDLIGQGTEYLVREDGTVAAKFHNGNFVTPASLGNTDPTVIPLAS